MTSLSQKASLIGKSGDSLRETFGKTLVKIGENNKNFVVFDADLAGGTGTHHFRKKYPKRFYQFGIAEQNMMSAAAGFSISGTIPVVTTFAVFCIRAVEQIRLSIAYANRNVKIVASHPGLDVGPDGASAQCLEDLAVFRSIPNLTVISPADHLEMAQATNAILNMDGPVYMRSGRSPAPNVLPSSNVFKIGKGQIIQDGEDITIVATGVQLGRAIKAIPLLANRGISVRLINMPTIKPIDSDLLIASAKKTRCFLTTEDHNIIGGLGSAVSECISSNFPVPVFFNGVKDIFGESGEPDELVNKYRLSSTAIAEDAINAFNKKT